MSCARVRVGLIPFFFFNDTATTEIYTLSLHDALPICGRLRRRGPGCFSPCPAGCTAGRGRRGAGRGRRRGRRRSEEHTSELQSPCNLVCRLLLEKKKTIYKIVWSVRRLLSL